MKRILLLLISLIPCMLCAETPPTRESVERLLILTDVKVLVEKMQTEVAGVANGLMKTALKGRALKPKEQQLADAALKKIIDDSRVSITWEMMRDSYVPLYQEMFTQEEVNGMISFYESPAGKALMTKMPTVSKEAARILRERLVPVMATIKSSAEEATANLSANLGRPLGP